MSRTAPRLYLSDTWTPGQTIALPEDRAHYLTSVLRAQPGMEVRLFNAERGEWAATVAKVGKRKVEVTVERLARAPMPEPERCLLFAPLKRAPMEWLAEKATELGATRLLPVITARTQGGSRGGAKASGLNIERLQAICIEAAEQCERLSVPMVAAPLKLADALAGWHSGRTLQVALEREAAAPPLHVTDASGPAALLIGPEGGFDEVERAWLKQLPFVKPVSLGPRILRAETAALVALAAWLEK